MWASDMHSGVDSIQTVFKAIEQMIDYLGKGSGKRTQKPKEAPAQSLIEEVNLKETEKKWPEAWEGSKKDIMESKRVSGRK